MNSPSPTRSWLRNVGPMLGAVGVLALLQAVYVLYLHREGSKHDVAPLALPRHYLLQKPASGNFDDECLRRGWSMLSPEMQLPSFANGSDRERQLGVVLIPQATGHLRVSIREPAPRPTVLQIEFVDKVPDDGNHPLAQRAKEVLITLDDACGVPYVSPAEFGQLPRAVVNAFRQH